jgi:hypothetical protein
LSQQTLQIMDDAGARMTFVLTLTLPPASGAMTFTLPGPPVSVFGVLIVPKPASCAERAPPGTSRPECEPRALEVVSGTVSVRDSSAAGYHATFALDLRTSVGEMLSVTGGTATVSGCTVDQACGE